MAPKNSKKEWLIVIDYYIRRYVVAKEIDEYESEVAKLGHVMYSGYFTYRNKNYTDTFNLDPLKTVKRANIYTDDLDRVATLAKLHDGIELTYNKWSVYMKSLAAKASDLSTFLLYLPIRMREEYKAADFIKNSENIPMGETPKHIQGTAAYKALKVLLLKRAIAGNH